MNLLGALFAAALVTNGGFESGTDGWNIGKQTCRVVDGAGRAGSKGLVWQNDDPNLYKFTTQKLALEPGCTYAFSGWVKPDGVTNATLSSQLTNISLEMYDTKGKFLGMTGTRPVVDNQVVETGWTKFEASTPIMPANLGHATLVCSVLRGSTGRVVFDDLEIVPRGSKPVPTLISSAYRDVAAAGTVAFVARCVLNPLRDPHASVQATYRLVGATNEIRRQVQVTDDGTARLTLDVSLLAKGTHPVRFELARRDGTPLDARELDFTRVDSLPTRKVCFDAHGRTLVDGKPFFPLGLYSSRAEGSNLATYCEGPFNCILPYALPPEKTALDPYHARGLKVIACVSDFTGFRNTKLKGRFDERAYTARYLEAMKDHPALLAWYLADELDVSLAENLRERNLQVRAADPDHPTYIVLENKDRPADFAEGCDIIGMDPYPIGNDASVAAARKRLPTVSLYAEAALRQTCGFRPMWQVPQTFDWTWYRPWAARQAGAHMPTLDEMRNMNWQAIASGANGLIGWWFAGIVRYLKGEAFDKAWADVKIAFGEVAEKIPLLLSVEPAPKVAKKPADISARTWRKDGVLWLLAVNRTYDPASGVIELEDGRKAGISLKGLGYQFVKVD